MIAIDFYVVCIKLFPTVVGATSWSSGLGRCDPYRVTRWIIIKAGHFLRKSRTFNKKAGHFKNRFFNIRGLEL